MTHKDSKQLNREINRFLKANPKIKQFEVLASDICGHFFGKRYPIDKLDSFARDGLAFPMSTFVLGTLGASLQGIAYGDDDGDPDAHFYLIP